MHNSFRVTEFYFLPEFYIPALIYWSYGLQLRGGHGLSTHLCICYLNNHYYWESRYNPLLMELSRDYTTRPCTSSNGTKNKITKKKYLVDLNIQMVGGISNASKLTFSGKCHATRCTPDCRKVNRILVLLLDLKYTCDSLGFVSLDIKKKKRSLLLIQATPDLFHEQNATIQILDSLLKYVRQYYVYWNPGAFLFLNHSLTKHIRAKLFSVFRHQNVIFPCSWQKRINDTLVVPLLYNFHLEMWI